jgi:hypothetical protein
VLVQVGRALGAFSYLSIESNFHLLVLSGISAFFPKVLQPVS